MLRKLIKFNIYISNKLDSLLPDSFIVDGYSDFTEEIVPLYLRENTKIYDVGGGKQPHLSLDSKNELNAEVIGIDIDAEELSLAPNGVYDETIAVDITRYQGRGDGDLVICKALLEHVMDTGKALQALASIAKKNGEILIFVPSGNAIFAKINLIIPESFKKKILFSLFPQTKKAQGFKAYYDRCTPRTMSKVCRNCDLDVLEFRPYFKSGYFSFFFPLHMVWRIWIILFRLIAGRNAAESFVMVLGKKKSTNV
jgi:2-polyprenyl-3-methyl-5-hydroxy-6-metoxy-1,4-benzoquinol methylase